MRIAVLVDLTPICSKAVEFGGHMAENAGAELVLVHVTESGGESDSSVKEELAKLGSLVSDKVKVVNHVQSGSFFTLIPTIITDLEADLVVVPTHGKVGIMQNLFGANILKLVQQLPVPALVVQENSVLSNSAFEKLLFPVGPHTDFQSKYKQAATFAKLFNSTVIIYTVRNDIRGVSDQIRQNIADSKSYFEQQNVKFENVSDEPTGFSAGYAKHILNYADQAGANAICILARVSDENGYIGKADKENILLNSMALPVFCASDPN